MGPALDQQLNNIEGIAMLYYLTGLCIAALAVGHRWQQTDGWLVLGIGLVLVGLVNMMLNYLDDRRSEE